MSEELRGQILLSLFTEGLKPAIRAQILIEDPKEFHEAIDVADRIERAQSMLIPNVNVIRGAHDNSHNIEEMLRSNNESYAKTLNSITEQLERFNSRLNDVEKNKEVKGKTDNNHGQREYERNFKCFYCEKQGNYYKDCRKRLADENNFRGHRLTGHYWGNRR